MAVLSGATASGRVMYSVGSVPTSLATVYTAPVASANVTSPSATAYIKEIILTNTSASPQWVSVDVAGIYIVNALNINSNDTKVLSGLNTMIPASGTISVLAQGSGMVMYISGVEIQ